MKILLSNDDGINARGLKVLADYIKEIADISIIAPNSDGSGQSNALTLNRPLYPSYLTTNVIAVDGTPADCVHLGINGLLQETPRRVISGINKGANLGDDVVYSGTIGAAIEGRFLDLAPIAVSLVGSTHYETAGQIIATLLQSTLLIAFPQGTILNINVPDVPISSIVGVKITYLGSRKQSSSLTSGFNPRGKEYYWIGASGAYADNAVGTDFYAVQNNYVSITPLHIDMTQKDLLNNNQVLEIENMSFK